MVGLQTVWILLALSGLPAAVGLSTRGALAAPACPTVSVSSEDFPEIIGVYTPLSLQNGRQQYAGPNAAILRYEVKNSTDGKNGGADGFLDGSGWTLSKRGFVLCGLKTDDDIDKFKGTEAEWLSSTTGAASKITVQCEEGPPDELIKLLGYLRENQAKVAQLEYSMELLKVRIGDAETAVVFASDRVTSTSRSLAKMEGQARANEHRIWNLTRKTALLASETDTSSQGLQQVKEQGQATGNATGDLEGMTDRILTRERLTQLEDWNHWIWDAVDPTKPGSMDQLEAKAKDTEKNIQAFEEAVADKVRSVLVKRLRRGANGMRRALVRLGRAAQGQAAESDAQEEGVEGDAPFGEQVGLVE